MTKQKNKNPIMKTIHQDIETILSNEIAKNIDSEIIKDLMKYILPSTISGKIEKILKKILDLLNNSRNRR